MSPFRFDTRYLRLPEALFARVAPEPVPAPEMLVFNDALAEELGLGRPMDWAPLLSGNELPEGATPIAQAYAGHQFGHFTMLGDGRAVLLGEHVAPDGRRVDVQLKGSGRTPFARRGDGRAVVGPMLREYLVSEAMHAMGIPTTRGLAVVATGAPVLREEIRKGAVLTRVASSHLRVGTFEYAAARGDGEALEALVDHAIELHAPEAARARSPALELLSATLDRQARLVAGWMGIGFIHGVMNTDNMTLSGETIDYGPCAFMDAFDPGTVFSSIDRGGRYAFGNQPTIAHWNLVRLAEALLSRIHADEDAAIAMATEALDGFPDRFEAAWLHVHRAKLGLAREEEGDRALVQELLDAMHRTGADFTNTFRALAEGVVLPAEDSDRPVFDTFLREWESRLGREERSLDEARAAMLRANPAIIPRNHRVEEALERAESGEMGPFHRLLEAVTRPYDPLPEDASYRVPPRPDERVRATFCGT
jgi:serine/tyrosine/threonine adenylyltransferase